MENFVMDFTPWAIVAGGYLVGSIVPGVLFVRLARGEDIRRLGSGNVGATNVGRVLGLPFALLTFAWDAFKGFGVCWFAQRLVLPPSFVVAGGLAAFLGHLYPCFFGFRGGKGVATAFGVVLALDPRVATISLGVWIVTLLFWKRAGAASLAAASSLLPATLFLSPDRPLRLLLLLLFTFFIFLRHEKNLDELLPPLP